MRMKHLVVEELSLTLHATRGLLHQPRPPCTPFFGPLCRELEGRAVIAKVDTEALPEIAGRFGIRGISTLVLFQAGRETKRTSGAMPAAVIAQTFGLD
jgi:thioredoxin-like negative regulator of GroEL